MLEIEKENQTQMQREKPFSSLEAVFAACNNFVSNLATVILGNSEALTAATVAVFSGGHLLLEDVPGVGKTTMAKAMSKLIGGKLARIQGNPDLLPSDILGVRIYSIKNEKWEFHPGPIFSNIILFDELNRTPPRSQSALLETMEESQVSIDGQTYQLPKNHLVIATQNPIGHGGTYPLVESQLDRFLVSASIGYPDLDTETSLVQSSGADEALSLLKPLFTADELSVYRKKIAEIYVSDKVARYGVEIAASTRRLPEVTLGASPRASISMISSAKTLALLHQRDFVIPDDIISATRLCLTHRLITVDPEAKRVDTIKYLLEKALSKVDIPL